jgi:hypothetical protein
MSKLTLLAAGTIFFMAYALKQNLLDKQISTTGFMLFLGVTFAMVVINKYL